MLRLLSHASSHWTLVLQVDYITTSRYVYCKMWWRHTQKIGAKLANKQVVNVIGRFKKKDNLIIFKYLKNLLVLFLGSINMFCVFIR